MAASYGVLNGNFRSGDYLQFTRPEPPKRYWADPKLIALERALLDYGVFLYGDKFSDWYDGPDVPAFSPTQERIDLIVSWLFIENARNEGRIAGE